MYTTGLKIQKVYILSMKWFLCIVWTSEPTAFLRTALTDGQTPGRKGKGELQTPRQGCTSGRSMVASVCGLWMDTFMKVKVKWSRYRPGVAQRVGKDIAVLFHDRGTRRGVSGQQHAPAAFYARARPGTHFTGTGVGPRASLDGRKISSPPGFDPGPSSP